MRTTARFQTKGDISYRRRDKSERTGKRIVLIRLLDATDSITSLTQLLHAAYARLGEMGFNYTAVDQSEDVTRERIDGGDCLVAVDGTTLAGTLTFHAPGRSDGCRHYDRQDVATIGQFGVLPRLQRQGVGNLLLREAERRAVLAGAAELALDTSEGAEHLIAWYARHGFRVVEHVQWPGKTYRSVIMSKILVIDRASNPFKS
jgi:GNAT superfamily N-acetyltransferase